MSNWNSSAAASRLSECAVASNLEKNGASLNSVELQLFTIFSSPDAGGSFCTELLTPAGSDDFYTTN